MNIINDITKIVKSYFQRYRNSITFNQRCDEIHTILSTNKSSKTNATKSIKKAIATQVEQIQMENKFDKMDLRFEETKSQRERDISIKNQTKSKQQKKETEKRSLEELQQQLFTLVKELLDELDDTQLQTEKMKRLIKNFRNLYDNRENSEIYQGSEDNQEENIEYKSQQSLQSKFSDKQMRNMFQQSVVKYLKLKYQYELETPKITFQDYKRIIEIWQDKENSENTKVVSHNFILETLDYKTFKRLAKSNWLNDEIINAYIKMLNRQYPRNNFKIVNTYFLPVTLTKSEDKIRKILQKEKITRQTQLVIPINLNGMHWYFVKIVFGIVYVYDSMKNKGFVSRELQKFCQWFYGNFQISVVKYPQQVGGSDCGVFMICGIKAVTFNLQFWDFEQFDIYYKRLSISKQLLDGKLMKKMPQICMSFSQQH